MISFLNRIDAEKKRVEIADLNEKLEAAQSNLRISEENCARERAASESVNSDLQSKTGNSL